MILKNKKDLLLNIIGFVYLILGILAILNTLYEGRAESILWMCYIFLILTGIGILIRNSILVMSQMNIMTFPLLIWTLDFLYVAIMKQPLLGITDYFFLDGPILGKIITSQHLFTIPLVYYSLYLMKSKSNVAWKASIFQLFAVFFISLIITSPESNINCVYKNCMNIVVPGNYQISWFIATIGLVLITSYIINKLSFLKEK